MKNRKRVWNGQSKGGYYGYLFFIYVLRFFGLRVAYFFLFFIIPYFILFSPKATVAIWKYNRGILKYNFFQSIFKLYAHFYIFGQVIIDKVAINAGMKSAFLFEYENKDEFLAQLNTDKGVIIIGAHIGCWEIGSTFFGDYGKRINIVMYDGENQGVRKALSTVKNSKNFNIIDINQDGISLIITMKNALEHGEYLCFQGDRYLHKDSLLKHDFMGQEAYFPKGVFEIAAKFDVPIVFYWAMRTKKRGYKFLFEIVDRQETIKKEDILDKYVTTLENVVRQYPQQWFNFYDFWKITK